MANASSQTGSSSPNFRIDVIFNSLRELQQEKERLEQHCNEEKARCRSLEIKLDACQTKYYQYSEKNCKMLETVNAAKQKVLQTQLQANRLKELNDGKRARITEVHRQIDEEMRKEEEEMQIFQSKLAELTSNFRNARNYYTEENVKKDMEEWSKQADQTKSEVSKEDITLKELSAKFHQLEMETKCAKDELNRKLEFDMTAEELQRAFVTVCAVKRTIPFMRRACRESWTVFEEVNQEAKGELEISEKKLMEELERIKQANSDYDRRDDISFCPNEQITSSEVDATNNNDAIEPSAFPLISAHSVPQVASNLTDGYEQPNIVSRQYLSIESTSVTPEKTAHQVHLQSEGRRSSLQGRSFFISLPVSSNN